jgi:hypothetical protein
MEGVNMKNSFQHYFSFSGTISQADFIRPVAVLFLIELIASYLSIVSGFKANIFEDICLLCMFSQLSFFIRRFNGSGVSRYIFVYIIVSVFLIKYFFIHLWGEATMKYTIYMPYLSKADQMQALLPYAKARQYSDLLIPIVFFLFCLYISGKESSRDSSHEAEAKSSIAKRILFCFGSIVISIIFINIITKFLV